MEKVIEKKQKDKLYDRATWPELIQFAFSTYGVNIAQMTVMFYLMFFLTDIFGIPIAIAGTIIMTAKIVDGVTDVLVGILSDKTRTRFGRYRPWIMIGTPFYAASFVALFWAPEISLTGKIIYGFVTYILYSIGLTVTNIPTFSLRSVITNDPKQRAYLAIPASIFSNLAAVIAMVLTVPMVNNFGGGAVGWRQVISFYAVSAVVAYYISLQGSKRRDNPSVWKNVKSVTIKEQLNMYRHNNALIALIAACATNVIATSIGAANLMYILTYLVNDQGLMPILSGINLIIGLIFAFITIAMVRKIDKKTLFTWGSYLGIIPPLLIFIIRPYDNIALFVALSALTVAIGPLTSQIQWSMVPDCVEYGQWKTGVRTPGAVSSGFLFVNKIGMAMGGLISGLALGAVGYVAKQEQSEAVKEMFIYLTTLIPIAGHICSIIAMRFYPISRKFFNQMLEEIKSRDSVSEV